MQSYLRYEVRYTHGPNEGVPNTKTLTLTLTPTQVWVCPSARTKGRVAVDGHQLLVRRNWPLLGVLNLFGSALTAMHDLIWRRRQSIRYVL